jgi:hypothetical protein
MFFQRHDRERLFTMADTNNKLPEGTDTVIEAGGTGGSGGGMGRSGTTNQGGSPSTATNSTGGRTSVTSSDSQTDALITGTTGGSSGAGATGGTTGSTGAAGSTGSSAGSSGGSSGGDDSSSGGVRGMVGNVTTKARDEAMNRARGFVGDGLKSGSATLGNVANIIEDTIEQIGERLGPQYADYARTASTTINRYATTLENKNPDELVDDARELIRKSPGVALTGAAIIGFGLVRLLKVGMPQESSNGTSDRQSDRTGSTR